jgi:ubiquinone/menaquinone biosynthesis C-methylase UbiE
MARSPDAGSDTTNETLDDFLPDLLPYSTVEYWSPGYWNRRYSADPAHFEWYLPWRSFQALALPHIRTRDAALDLGCGNSSLAASLVDAKFRRVVAIDISDVVISQMKEGGSCDGTVDFQTADAAALPFAKREFDVVVDKGTLDSLLTAPSSSKVASICLSEVVRVLKPNGIYVMVSYAPPKAREAIVPNSLDLVNVTQVASDFEGIETFSFVYILQKNAQRP